MKIVVAPDKFAGTLTAAEAARALAAGWSSVRPGDEVVQVPMADGGEGTLDVVEAAVPGSRRMVTEAADARGRAVEAAWLLLPDGRALVEAAQACGLTRLEAGERNPRLATSYGVGQLVRAAVAGGARQVVVTLGGSATVDAGTGMAVALGHRLLRADGNGLKVGGEFGGSLDRVETGAALGVPVVAAVDVSNPLLGPDGAVAVYAPQKGAAPEDLPVLEEALRVVADVVERDVGGGPWRDLPGAGAAGGLGFGLAAFCGATLERGAAAVGGLCGLDAALAGADVVVTGEGHLDAQTAAGKVPSYVLEQARAGNVRALAVAGQVSEGAGTMFDAVRDLGAQGMERAAELVTERAAELAKELS